MLKAIINFHGDPSVGISSYSFTAEIPETEMDDKEYREETRELIKKFYADLDGEFVPTVTFSDENQNDDQDF